MMEERRRERGNCRTFVASSASPPSLRRTFPLISMYYLYISPIICYNFLIVLFSKYNASKREETNDYRSSHPCMTIKARRPAAHASGRRYDCGEADYHNASESRCGTGGGDYGDRGEELEKHISKMRVVCLRNGEYAGTELFDSICMGLNYIEDLCDRVLVMPTKALLSLSETIEKIMESRASVLSVYDGRRVNPVMIAKDWIRRF